MSGSWVAKSFSSNSTPVAITDEMMNEHVVILLQGKNATGDEIYSYLKLALKKLIELKKDMLDGKKFLPSDYGTVLAAGRGEPGQELKSEMAVTYKMLDVPTLKRQAAEEAKKIKPKMGPFAIQYSPEE